MDAATLNTISTTFTLGAPRAAPTAVPGGLTNRFWRVETDRGVFAVKEMNRDPDRTDYVEWFDRAFSLEQAAFRAGVPMPRPIPVTGTGRCLAEILPDGEPPMTVRVHEWVDAEPMQNGVVYDSRTIERAATILARIHSLRMSCDATPADALLVFGAEHWRGIVARAASAGEAWAPLLEELLPSLAELERYLLEAHEDPTPLVMSHRDADPKNTMCAPSGELILIDWDAAAPVNPRQDLANCALVWAAVHAQEPDMDAARTYVRAYRRAGGFDEPFRQTDLAELVALRLSWLNFNLRRARGERIRDGSDREAGIRVLQRNITELPRFLRSLEKWIAVLGG